MKTRFLAVAFPPYTENMWFEDLTECDYFSNLISRNSLAVGWLENGKPYQTGEAPETLIEKLYEFITAKDITHAFLGVHECDLCDIEYLRENSILLTALVRKRLL